MELLGPGGVLERFNYAKLPRTAQYEVIKEVLWVAYKDTWRREDSIPTEKPVKHDYRKTMKFAIKVKNRIYDITYILNKVCFQLIESENLDYSEINQLS